MLSYLKTKKRFLIGVFIISILAVFLIPHITYAGGDGLVGGAVKYVGIAVAYLLIAVIKVLGIFLGLAGWLMDKAITFPSLKTEGVVKGWEILRDLVNMFFILVLLIVAFATVLNIPKYSVKDILPRLVIVALLINFSLPLVYVVVDAAQIVMYGIYNAMVGGLSGDCAAASIGVCFSDISKVAELLIDTSPPSAVADAAGAWKTVMNLIMAVIFLLVFTVVVVAGALLLIIRIVGIWVAAIFSPLAFFSRILPGTSFFYNTWMKKFLQYTFFGPLYVFFLWISLILLQDVPNFMKTAGIDPSYKVFGDAPVSGFVSQISNILQFIMVIVLLSWSFLITRHLGIKYGEKIAGGAEKFMWDGAHSVGKKFSGYNMGKRYVDAYKGRREDVERKKKARVDERYNRRVGGAKEFVGGTVGKAAERIPIAGRLFKRLGASRWGEEQSRQAEFQYESRVGEEQKKVAHITDGHQLHDFYTRAVKGEEKEAILRRAAEVGGLDDLLIKAGEHDSNDGLRRFMIKEFGNNDRSAKVAKVLADITAMKTHQTQFQGVADYDSKTGGYTFKVDPNTRANKIFKAAGGDFPQSMARQLRKHQFGTLGKDGAFADVNEDLITFLEQLKQGGFDWSDNNIGARQLKGEVVRMVRDNKAEFDRKAGVAAMHGKSALQEFIKQIDALPR